MKPGIKKYLFFILTLAFLAFSSALQAQCSICTRTAQQLGERPARALNAGVIYLALAPVMIAGFIGYKWWQRSEDKARKTPE